MKGYTLSREKIAELEKFRRSLHDVFYRFLIIHFVGVLGGDSVSLLWYRMFGGLLCVVLVGVILFVLGWGSG